MGVQPYAPTLLQLDVSWPLQAACKPVSCLVLQLPACSNDAVNSQFWPVS